MNAFNRLLRKFGYKIVSVAEEARPENNASTPLEAFQDAPDLFHQYRVFVRQPELKRKPGGWEYRGRFYQDYLTVGGASHTIFRVALRYCTGTGIDVGAGLWPLPGAVPVDVWRGPGSVRTLGETQPPKQLFVSFKLWRSYNLSKAICTPF